MYQFTHQIISLLEQKQIEELKQLVNQQDVYELVGVFKDLKIENRRDMMVVLFRLLNKDLSIEVFEQFPVDLQEELLDSFTDDKAIEMVSELEPDDRARLLDEVPAKVAKRLLNALSPDKREKTAGLLGYAPETAGRIMTPEYVSFKKMLTVGQALDRIRTKRAEAETIYTLYVTDSNRKLLGVLSLGDLVVSDPEQTLDQIMNPKVISVTTDTDQEETARLVQATDLLAVPVVDREERLVGIITVDDAIDILEQEATEDIYKKTGIGSFAYRQEESRSSKLIYGSIWDVWRVRLPFLVVTLAGGLLAGLVIDVFEQTLEAIVALAIFIPVIMDMGGNVGTQSSTIFTRAMVLGQINMAQFMRYFGREVFNGASMGLVMGTVTLIIATWWQGMIGLGLAVGLSMFFTITLATGLGFLTPYILTKLGFDQTAGTAPIITTIKDVSGLAIYFALVNLFLSHLI